MPDLPWSADHELDAERVARILSEASLDLGSVVFLDEGWDNRVFLAGGEWILRFPKQADVARAVPVEVGLLRRLAELSLPVATPRIEIVGEPSSAEKGGLAPYPWLGYRRVPGEPAHTIAPTRAHAERIGETLAVLHALEPSSVSRSRCRDVEVLRRRVLERFDELPVAIREVFLREAMPDPFVGVPRVLHADLHTDHLLVRDGAISGVIDWSDACLSDPAADFVGLFLWGDRELFDVAVARYPFADEGLARRARWMAFCVAIYGIVYGQQTGKRAVVERNLRVFERNA